MSYLIILIIFYETTIIITYSHPISFLSLKSSRDNNFTRNHFAKSWWKFTLSFFPPSCQAHDDNIPISLLVQNQPIKLNIIMHIWHNLGFSFTSFWHHLKRPTLLNHFAKSWHKFFPFFFISSSLFPTFLSRLPSPPPSKLKFTI